MFVEDFKYTRGLTDHKLKITLPGPMTICDTIADAHYGSRPDMAMAFAEILNEEAKELEAAGWQELRFDFDSPRVTAISYRVILRVEPADPTKEHLTWFDDLRLIEWLSPSLDDGPVPGNVPYRLTTHAEVLTR